MRKRIALLTAVLMGFAGLALGQPAPLDLDDPDMQALGKAIFFDKISAPDSMACAECHAPSVGWTGPNPGINKGGAVYRGAVPQRFGNRKPPSSGYATVAPVFYYDEAEELFVGGNFWDGRATGWLLGNPAADQALGPFLNPVEQNNPDEWAVIEQVCNAKYAGDFMALFEEMVNDVEGTDIDPCNPLSEDEILRVYHFIGWAVAAYEHSDEVNAFSSKYDAYLAEEAALSAQEEMGLELFEGKAMCAACHPSGGSGALFTDFTYDNLGVPKNPANPFYDMDTVYLDDGTPINPEGEDWVDPGLAGFLETLIGKETPLSVAVDQTLVDENLGKHKVPTLRNVDLRPGTGFVKAFGHNGFFKSLEGIVHFYNTRDTKPSCPDGTMYTEKEALAQGCWPAPEVEANVNEDELGNLGLTDAEEAALVAFLRTLSDGWTAEKGNKKK